MLRYVAYLHAWLGFGQPSLVFVVKRRVEKEGKVAEGTAKGSKRALRRTLHTSAMSKDDVGDQLWAAGRTFATLHSVTKSSKCLIFNFYICLFIDDFWPFFCIEVNTEQQNWPFYFVKIKGFQVYSAYCIKKVKSHRSIFFKMRLFWLLLKHFDFFSCGLGHTIFMKF